MKTSVASLLAATILAACGALAPATCDAGGFVGNPELSCDQAIAAARVQYAATPGIIELVVQYGTLCPPNARCVPPAGDIATVIAILEDGSELYVTVRIGPDGAVSADPPQPVPFDRDR